MREGLVKVVKRVRAKGRTVSRGYWVRQGPVQPKAEPLDEKRGSITAKGGAYDPNEMPRVRVLQRLRVAKQLEHPMTPLSTYHEGNAASGVLSHRDERALAKNPNTPPHILEKLAERHPKEVLENPATMLARLENPAFLKNNYRMAEAALVQGLTRKDVLDTFNREHVRLVVMNDREANSPKLSSQTLDSLYDAYAQEPLFQRQFLRHPNASDALLDRAAKHPSKVVADIAKEEAGARADAAQRAAKTQAAKARGAKAVLVRGKHKKLK